MRKKQNDTPLTEVDAKRIRRNAYIKMAAMVGIVAALMAFGSIAWFTMNREVEGKGVQMTAAGDLFEIQTTGEVANEKVTPTSFFKSFLNAEATPKINNSKDGSIIWLLSSDAPEGVQSEKNKFEHGLNPGSSGELSFTIVPEDDLGDYDLSTNYTINVTAYTLSSEAQERIASAEEDEAPEITFVDLEPLPVDNEASNYVCGHIMFFATVSTANGRTTLSDKITPGQAKAVPQFHSDIPKTVTIRWKWPEYFSDITNATDTNTICAGADLAALKSDMELHPELYFDRLKSDLMKEDGTLAEGTFENLAENASDLSKAYNNADSSIGKQVKYVLIEVTVDGALTACSGHDSEP